MVANHCIAVSDLCHQSLSDMTYHCIHLTIDTSLKLVYCVCLWIVANPGFRFRNHSLTVLHSGHFISDIPSHLSVFLLDIGRD